MLVFVGRGSHRNEVLSVDWKAGDEDMLVSAGMDDYIMIWWATHPAVAVPDLCL